MVDARGGITLKTGVEEPCLLANVTEKGGSSLSVYRGKDVLQRHVLALESLRLSYYSINNGTFGG
jgi:hypothetical protein